MVCPPQQAVEVKLVAQDEVEVVGCVVVTCCGVVWGFVCLIHSELVVVGKLQVDYVVVVVVTECVVDEVEVMWS